ncbi:50S ribosomal protein L32 [Patescibacteria group bacterium]|nr:50S ribosomal protein L32 [Patescibacteria group bacterium]
MALPGHRRTSSHKRRRAAHFALKKTNLSVCPKCKKPVMSHHACKSCGTYAGREVVKMKTPKKKKK